jgi:hypothetical protein
MDEAKAPYEKTDAQLQTVLRFGLALAALVAVALVLMRLLFGYLTALQAERDVAPGPMSESRVELQGPRLQVNPASELREKRLAEEEVLNSYGWVDRRAGTVRIPIERAMDILAERGLPVREDAGR